MKNRQKLIFIVVVFVVLAVVYIYINNNKNDEEVYVVSKIDNYNYILDSNETKLYKDNFKKLEELLISSNIDEKEYAKLVAILFTIDFYNLDNKITNQDVGGLQFVSEVIKDNFYSKAINTIYKYIESDIYNNRKQELPKVKNVSIISIDNEEIYEDDIYDENSYVIKLKIEYEKNLGYSEEISIRLVHEDIKLNVVEVKQI